MQAQQLLRGKYVLQTSTEVALTIEFSNSDFKFIEDYGMTQKVGVGKYELRKDSLLLMFKTSVNEDSSWYDIEYKRGNNSVKNSSNVSLVISDYQSELPFKYPLVILRDNLYNPVVVSIGDSLGRSNLILYENRFIKYLDINPVGYNSVSIPTEKLIGNNVLIRAKLKSAAKIYIPQSVEAYHVIEIKPKRLILQKHGEKLVFVKT